jgi:hypothetical protein
MGTFDFCIRLDELIAGCGKGGNTPAELQSAMVDAIKSLNVGGEMYKEIFENGE